MARGEGTWGKYKQCCTHFGLIFISKTLMDHNPRDVGGGISLAGDWLSFGGDRDAKNGKLVAQTSSI
jgi:hypothetical protein